VAAFRDTGSEGPQTGDVDSEKVDAAGRQVRQIELCKWHCEIAVSARVLASSRFATEVTNKRAEDLICKRYLCLFGGVEDIAGGSSKRLVVRRGSARSGTTLAPTRLPS
jgi:hypothetical protein